MRVDAPMMTSYPRITKCERCDHIFWLDTETKVEGVIMPYITNFYDDVHQTSETKNPAFGDQLELHPAKDLERDDIKDALFMNVQRDEEDELYLRYLLLWAYHKQLEDGSLTREALNEDRDYLENIDSLLRILVDNANEEDGTLLLAELHRFAGRFNRSLELLAPYLDDPLWDSIVQKMKSRCEEGNREVMILDIP
jgi:hypothetical protein